MSQKQKIGETKQRGSGWSIGFAIWLYRALGYKTLYYFMYPTAFFYFVVAGNVKEALRDYYEQIDVEFNNRVYYEHLRVFAICLVDRFISKIDPQDYSFTYENMDLPKKILSSGSLMLHSHFGGWASSSSGVHVENKINIVMQETMLDGIKKIENSMGQESQLQVIDVNKGAIHVSVAIANALMNDEVVAIMADRASSTNAELEVPFFNKMAYFNKNPFQVAYKIDKPIIAYFILLVGMQHYKVEYVHIEMDRTKKESEAVEEAVMTYVKKYEELIKQYPNQWFNLYKFWERR